MMGIGRDAMMGGAAFSPNIFEDVLPPNVAFRDNDLPFAYRDPRQALLMGSTPEATPTMSPLSGVKVFDFSNANDVEAMRELVQQVSWGYCRFEVFNLQFHLGVFKAFVVWTMYQKMPATEVKGMKQRAWEVIRRIHGGK